jgi:inosine/xanthosine triphosphate pyrophosphatase family protein
MLNQSKKSLKEEKIILLATHNPSKIERFQTNLKIDGVKLISPDQISLSKVDAKEDGEDEFVNSEIKARAYFYASGVISLSLDTGFYVENLPDEQQPGKHVQRIAGVLEGDSDEIRYQKMVDYYINIAKSQGGTAMAYFKDVFCLFDGKKIIFSEGKRPSLLTTKINQKDLNFPIASIYKVPQFNKYYHDLNKIEMLEYIKPSLKAASKLINDYLRI